MAQANRQDRTGQRASARRPVESPRLSLLRPSRGVALASALIVLAGCSAISSMGRGLGSALLPGSSNESRSSSGQSAAAAAPARSSAPAQRPAAGLPPDPNRPPRADTPTGSGGDMDARLARLEEQVAALRADMDRAKPNIDRLVGIEDDIRILLGQLARLNDPNAPPPAPRGAAPAAAAPAAPAAGPGAPPGTLAPPAATNSAPILGGPRPLTPLNPVAGPAAPAQPAAAPTASLATPAANGRAAPTVAARDQLAVHIASYRDIDGARRGWQEMQQQQGNLLTGLDYRISPVTLSGGRGTYYRLKAGPFTDAASANEVCSALKARRVYCVVSDFGGSQ